MVRFPRFVALCLATLVSVALIAATPAPSLAVAPDSLSAYSSGYTRLCYGYTSCANAGYSNSGYAEHRWTMYWRMYAGHNCTNYAAYRMVRSGMPNSRPWSGSGNATNWGSAMSRITNSTPTVGAVAWWRAYQRPAGSAGHVAYVERVISSNEIVVSQDSWGGDFSWARITRSSGYWPSGFVHFNDIAPLRSTGQPTVTGTPAVGSTLRASTGSWNMSGLTFSYQWRGAGAAIPGATSSTLTVPPSLVGRSVRVLVTAHRAGQQDVVRSSAKTAPVAPATITTEQPATITGKPRVGRTLTLTYGATTPADAEVSVQWLRSGVEVPGATSSTYPLTLRDLGATMTARLTAVRTGYKQLVTTSAGKGPVRSTPVVAATLTPGPARLTARVTVTAPGTTDLPGVVAVRRDDELVGLMRLTKGAATVTFTRLDPGPGRFRFWYRGSELAAPGRVWSSATIGAATAQRLVATPSGSPSPTVSAKPSPSPSSTP